LPLVAIIIPRTGALSRKERDDLKAYGAERGLRVYDDPNGLDRDFAEPMTKVRDGLELRRDLSCWQVGREPKGHLPEQTVLQACGQLRMFADRTTIPQTARSDVFKFFG